MRVQLAQQATHVHHETLRRARVRADMVACLIVRALWTMVNIDTFSFYCFVDGSPQWRGHEMFAASIDIIGEGFFERLLLPLVSLARCCLGASGTFILVFHYFCLLYVFVLGYTSYA